MKKLFTLVILVLIASMLAVPAFAAQSATVTVAASSNSVGLGDTFTVTVSTSKVEDCFSGGFLFQYDKNVFEYVEGSALVKDFTISGVSTANDNLAGYFMNTDKGATVEGALFQATFKVKDTAAEGNYTITGESNLTIYDGGKKTEISSTTKAATIAVALAEEPEQPTDGMLGDINDDGTVSLKDLVRLRKFLAEAEEGIVINEANADVNNDGVVTLKDMVRMRKHLADDVALG